MSNDARLREDVGIAHPDLETGIAKDDYALSRVPEEARYSWVSVAMQRLGQLSALAQFMLAAYIGAGMTFWNAMLAILLGSVLLEIVTIFTGIAGVKEGLSPRCWRAGPGSA